MRSLLCPAACLLAFPLSPALAQGDPAAVAKSSGDFLIVGAGLASMPDYDGSDDRRIMPVPGAIGQVGGIKFFYLGDRISVDLLVEKPGARWDVQLGPVASVGFNRARVGDVADPRIKALGGLGYAVELGGYVGLARTGVITSAYDQLSVTVSYRRDVAGAHGGGLLMPTVNYMTPLSRKALVLVFAQATHADRRYNERTYGVDAAQSAASGLPVYRARAGWKSVSAGVGGDLSLTGDLTSGLSLIGGVMYARLLGSAAESPATSIAGQRDQWFAGLGLAYAF